MKSIFILLDSIITIYLWIIIINAILSWLVAFNILNTQNKFVFSVLDTTYKLTDPALSSQLVAANGATYVELYKNVNLLNRQHYTDDFGQDLFGTPKTVKMGVSVGF